MLDGLIQFYEALPPFSAMIAHFSGSPLLQILAIVIAICILEDPTTITCGLLVADGQLDFGTAFVGLFAGIIVCDCGFYLLGRALGPRAVSWGLVTQRRLDRARDWFHENFFLAVVGSRFVPGMRITAYIGAGIIHASAAKFFYLVIVASLLWTIVILNLTIVVGVAVLPLLGEARWYLAGVFVLFFIGVQARAARKKKRALDTEPEKKRVVSFFEFWPSIFFYLPVGVYYALLVIRYRSLTLPTASNPVLYSGGFIMESKSAVLSKIPEPVKKWVAPYVVLNCSGTADDLLEAERGLADAEIAYPIVAKPDVGLRGAGVQPVQSAAELKVYLKAFPVGRRVVLQKLIEFPDEAGVVYYRKPGEAEGVIFSVTLKYAPYVTGDGKRTLRELILADERARLIPEIYFERHAEELDRILPSGERQSLVFARAHCQGAVFKDGTHLITPELYARIKEITDAIPGLYYARYDIKYKSLAKFLQGEAFQIIEINGATGEPTHIWDAGARLRDAYGTLFRQYRVLFEIGDANRKRGHPPLGTLRVIKDLVRYRRLRRNYPKTK